MDSLIKLRESLNRSIRGLDRQVSQREEVISEIDELSKIIDDITFKISNDNYNIDNYNIDRVSEFFKKYNDIVSELDKLKEAISIINYPDEFGILGPQVAEAKKSAQYLVLTLDKMKKNFATTVSQNNRKIASDKELLDKYKKYLGTFNNDGIISEIDDSLLEEFFAYVRDCGLSDEEVYEVIFEFSKYNLSIYEKKYLDRMNTVRYMTTRNIKNVEMAIEEEIEKVSEYEEDTLEEIEEVSEVTTVTDKVIFDDEDRICLEKIKEIMNLFLVDEIDNDYELLNVLRSDDYGLSVRRDLYSVNRLPLICYDIRKNLINNITLTNKDEIFEVFRYVISIYEQSLDKEDKVVIELSKEDVLTIKEYLDKFRSVEVNEEDSKLIDSYYSSVDFNSSTSELVKMFGVNTEILYFVLHRKLDELYSSYLADREAGFELYNSGDYEIDEFNAVLSEDIKMIRNILMKILEYNEYIKSEDEKDNTDTLSNIDGEIVNSLVFLNADHIEEDRENILKYGVESMISVNQCLTSLRLKNIVELRKINNKKFKVSKNCRDDLNYRRIASGFGRTLYTVVPVNLENRLILSKNGYVATNTGNIILVFGIGSKYAGDNSFYADSIHRIENGNRDIQRILDIFSNKFTEESKKEAFDLLEQGKNIVLQLHKGEEISTDINDDTHKGRKN